MRELEPYGDLEKLVFDVAQKKLTDAKTKVLELAPDCDPKKMRGLIEELNRWVDFICDPDDDELYDEFRQRLFNTGDGRAVTFGGGEEVDVDVRRKRRKK